MMTESDSLNEWNERQIIKDDVKMSNVVGEIKEEELWSLDTTLTDYILPRIIAFRKMERHGYPVEDGLLDEEYNPSEEHKKTIEKRSMLQWEDTLRCIELAFSLMSKSQSFERSEQANKDIKIGLELFAKHYEHLWD